MTADDTGVVDGVAQMIGHGIVLLLEEMHANEVRRFVNELLNQMLDARNEPGQALFLDTPVYEAVVKFATLVVA